MKAEERELTQGYGEQFVAYSKRVPFFIPDFRLSVNKSSTFLWARVIRNREHRTLAGLLLTEVFLILKLTMGVMY